MISYIQILTVIYITAHRKSNWKVMNFLFFKSRPHAPAFDVSQSRRLTDNIIPHICCCVQGGRLTLKMKVWYSVMRSSSFRKQA
jgi:hypothetical protein